MFEFDHLLMIIQSIIIGVSFVFVSTETELLGIRQTIAIVVGII
jgi:hypothetical protein